MTSYLYREWNGQPPNLLYPRVVQVLWGGGGGESLARDLILI